MFFVIVFYVLNFNVCINDLFRWIFLEAIPTPEVFPENELSNNVILTASQNDWMPTTIVGLMIISTSLIM